MRRTTLTLLAAALAAGCTEYTGPSASHDVYALARVGLDHLPVPAYPDASIPLLLADTFRLGQDRSRTSQQILRQITVLQDGPGEKIERSEVQFLYRIENGILLYDNCPMGYFCIAGLVAAPRAFQIVGDSLFEVVPAGVNTPPHIYGLVRYR
jgi:hypothetical protein